MKITDTISVNPGKATLGHVENNNSIFRSQVLNKEEKKSINLMSVIFPTQRLASFEFNKYSVGLRTLFSTILIVSGITMLNGTTASANIGIAICSLCFGGLLALGFFTRPVMTAAAIFYCITGALELRGGIVDMTLFFMMFGCLIFSVAGSGKYSFDTLMRRSIIKYKRSVDKKRTEECLGYKAFHNVRF